jgi:GMP synthase (glutamine-hydrolysing)
MHDLAMQSATFTQRDTSDLLYISETNLRDSSVETQSIVVLDFGAQYSQLIARRIRELKVFSVVLPFNATLEEIRSYSPVGIILSGGPSSVYDKDAPLADKSVFELGVPVLGI